ncbi:MAG TPA: MauE/DoxX family redox-associated membrane protein [Thermodesulfovibrionales bacterium]|jgi:uncharacterized membrane protein YphA (DoxX/SURF4 family)|nr:MauE/DoxX family redox-associated membrane protein [Thermodesulfovibrionales bacterium]
MSMTDVKKYWKKIFGPPWAERIMRFALGSVFIYAGFIKLLDPKTFAKVISQYDLIPESLLAPVAVGLPLVEFLAGLGLILNIRGSLSVIFSMLILFVFVLWYGILKDLSIDCGCFTPEEITGHNSLKKAFYRDLLMIGAVFYMYIHRFVRSEKKQPPIGLVNLL